MGDTIASGAFSPTMGSVVVSSDRGRVLHVGENEAGWLAKRGDIALGYLGDPEKTAQTFQVVAGERMVIPGDRARWLEDGTIELLGRDSETINSGGEKIFAEEVEAAISAHPDVSDVVISSRPSERWGQEVVAIVCLRPGSSTAVPELEYEAGRHVARFKLPKAWLIVDEIPRSPAGKADRRWASQIAAAPSPRAVSRRAAVWTSARRSSLVWRIEERGSRRLRTPPSGRSLLHEGLQPFLQVIARHCLCHSFGGEFPTA